MVFVGIDVTAQADQFVRSMAKALALAEKEAAHLLDISAVIRTKHKASGSKAAIAMQDYYNAKRIG